MRANVKLLLHHLFLQKIGQGACTGIHIVIGKYACAEINIYIYIVSTYSIFDL